MSDRIVDKIFWWAFNRWRKRQDSDSLRSFQSWIAFDIKNAEYREKLND